MTPQEIARALEISDCVKSSDVVADGEHHHAQVALAVADLVLTIRVNLPRDFPVSKPEFFLTDRDNAGRIPHVESHGRICYSDGEGLLLDLDQPEQVLRGCLDLARETLRKGLAGENHEDLRREFAYYWNHHWDERTPKVFIQRPFPALPKRIKSKAFPNGFWIPREFCVPEQARSLGFSSNGFNIDAILIPVPLRAELDPPWFDEFWTHVDFTALTRRLPQKSRRKLSRIARQLDGARALVLLEIAQPDHGRSIVASVAERIRPDPRESGAAIRFEGSLRPTPVINVEPRFLLARAGGSVELRKKRVCVVGCGAVGSHVAAQLAKSGVGRLTLVDGDVFKPENVFRHVLGFREAIWASRDRMGKAGMLKFHLEAGVPGCAVEALQVTVQNALVDGLVLADFDLIVTATGNPMVERWLNRRLFEERTKAPLLSTWLEPYGLGGHAIVSNNGSPGGCLECLTVRKGPENRLAHSASFAEVGQTFSQTLGWCGGTFTPYGILAAERTALLASQAALDCLAGRMEGSPVLSWKGRPDDFRAAGHETSLRFVKSEEELYEERYSLGHRTCETCGRSAS